MHRFAKLFVVLAALTLLGLLPVAASAGGYNPNNPNQGVVWFSPGYGPAGTDVVITGTGWRKERGQEVTVTVSTATVAAADASVTAVKSDGTFAVPAVTVGSGEFFASSTGSSYVLFTVKVGGTTITQWWHVTG